MSGDAVALELEGVTRRFGGLVALDQVSFSVRRGEVVGVIGPNGAGKSTLFEVISGGIGLTAGSIRYFGEDLSPLAPHERRRAGLSRTFQKIRLFNGLTVEQNVQVAARQSGGSRWREQVDSALRRMRLSLLAARKPDELTLADRKRVEIARAIVGRCRLLMLDESLCGLTHEEARELVGEILALNRQDGVTILVVEHVMPIVMSMAERLVVLDHGCVIADARPDEVAHDPEVVRAYLGGKQAAALREPT